MTMNTVDTGDDLQVLLVEDSKLLADRLLELILEIDGIAAVAAVSTEQGAIEAINAHHPDVIVLDLRLEQGTGFNVMRHINRSGGERPTIIVITNYALPSYRKEADQLGARYFLDKSRDFEQLPGILTTLRDERSSAS